MSTAADIRYLHVMHETHGITPDQTCRSCAYCVKRQVSHRTRGSFAMRVCRKADPHVTSHGRLSHRAWLVTWPACGLYQASEA